MEPIILKPKRMRCGYEVRIVIERFMYDPQIGSHQREVVDRPETTYNNWPLGDYETAQKADDAVRRLVEK